MRIVAIGGGEMGAGDTFPIDRHIVDLTGAARPRALFIPTASNDSPEYAAIFEQVYGTQLGCTTDVLDLLQNPPAHEELAQRISAADLIYVGGGNTLKMMRRWRHLGVDQMLLDAAAGNTVLCGLSAGALCWFAWGHSDSMSFYHPENWDYVRVRCLGLLPFTGCPHYDGEGRDRSFQAMISRTGGVGIAIDDCAAFEVENDQYRVLSCRNGAAAYRVERSRGEIAQATLLPYDAFAPLAQLLG